MKYISGNKIFNKYKKLVMLLILFALSLIFMPKVDAYTVTYPDNKVDTVEEGEKYILSMKDHKEPEIISTVTFKSHQDGVDDYVSHVKKKYFLEKWIIDGVEYEPGSPIEVNSDITVTGSYHEYIEPATIPSAPIVRGYTFLGWYDQEEGGTRYKTYSGTQDLTLHAQYKTENRAPFTVEVSDSKWTKFRSTATAFRKATIEEYNAKQAELTSSDNFGSSYYPLYIWLEGTELVYYTEFSSITTFRTSEMFKNWSKIEYIDLSGWYIPSATNLSYMFYNCSSLTYLDISDFDTSKITNMDYMFSGTKLASLDLSHFNTSKVTQMAGMFSNMGSLEYLNISSFDTSNVTNMSYMFSNSNINYLDLSNFNTSNVVSMLGMFSNSKNTNYLNISSFDTSKVTKMTSMFNGSSFKHLDLSNLDVSQANSFENMFYNAQSLEYVDLSNWDTRRSTSFYRMFKNCYNLKYLDLSSFKIYKATSLIEMFYGCRNLEELDLSSFDLNNVNYINYMFAGMSKIKTIDISNFSTPNLKNMQCLFCDDTSLETIYANELFNTDQCPTGRTSDGTMIYVFVRDDNLVGQAGTRFSEVHGTGKEYAVIDDPDNGKPGYFTYKAYNPKIYYPDMSYEEVEPYYVLTLPESYSKADDNLATVTLKYEDDKTEDKEVYVKKSYTFNNWLVYDEVAELGDTFVITFDTYLEADYVETIAGADLSPARRSGYKFLGWYIDPENGELVESYNGEEDITLYAHWGDAQVAYLIEGSTINGKFDKTNTTEFRRATLEEYNDATLTDDNIISTDDSEYVVYLWNTTIDSKVVTLYYTEADFMYMNADSSHMFQGLTNITELDLSDFITSNVTNMEYMFGYIGVTSLDLSTFDTSNVTKMNEMFFNSANLQELNVSSFDVSNVTTMVGMFDNCPSLEELDLSSFDTRKVKLMGSMFAYCSKLTTIYVSNKWSTSGLNQNANQSTMFAGDGRIMGYLGSKYDHYWHGDEKARIDGGPSNEGYLTDISHKGETHTVTFPDNSVKTYNHNSIVYLDTNETSLGEHTSGEITFKYHNGNIDTTSNQVFEMAGDGFTCDDKHYRDNGEIRVNSDKVIKYAYKPVITNSVFPENPVKDGYIFMGWFTEEEGGEKYTEYTGDEPIVLHAQYGLPISYLMSGSDINNKINYLTDDSSINEFRRGTIEEYNQAKDSFDDNYNIISTDESPLPTYMWYDGSNVLYYSDAENIYMNADSASMFSYTYASSIDVTEFDTSNVTDMSYMFSSGEMTELDLSHFNTNNVTNMSGMFQGCSSLQTIYVSNNWSTESLEAGNGEYMFSNDGNLVGSSGTTYDENHTDEEYARPDEGVSNPGYFTLVTFYNVTYPNSSTRSYKDGTVINLGENDSPAIIETAGTITFKYHDDKTEDTTLTKITTKTPNGFIVNGNHIDDNEDVTINEDKVIEYDYDETAVDNIFPVASKEGYEFIGWYTEETGGEKIEEYNGNEPITLHARYMAEFSKLKAGDEIQSKIFWSASGSFRKATLEEYNSVKGTLTDNDTISIEGTKPTYLWQTGENVLYYSEAETIYMNEDASSIFDSKSLSSIDLSGIDFSMTTNMYSIFRASDATTITLGNINTSNVTNMGSMFGQMSRLTSIDNLSFDTHNVTDMSYMFYDSHLLTELDLSDFDTSSVENMEYMFAGCNSLTSLNISSFETSQVTTMYSMFKYDSALTEINVSDFVTSNVESFSSMFEGCTSLSSIDVTNFDTQNANSLDGMFKDCSLLTTLDLSSFDTQNVMSISEMFSGDTSLETIYVSDAWSTNSIADWGRYDVFSYDENLVGGAGTVFDEEHTNYEYARIDGGVDNPGYLTLKVDQVLPTDFDFDADDIKMVVGQVHQIGVTFTPEGSGDTLTYSNYDDTKISVVDGLITGLSEGTTTITVGTENTDIEKTISITVLSDKLESTNYTVTDKVRPKENEEDPDITDRIIIGAEPGTLISDFKSNLDNPSEYIKIYDGDNELSDDDIVKTGLTIRLEVNGTIYDEAIIIIRGDINQDGLVNLMDKSVLSEQLLRLSDIEGYGVYAADIDNNDSINLMDKSKLSEYLLRLIDTLNE